MSQENPERPTEIAEAYFQAVSNQALRMVMNNTNEPRDVAYLFQKTAEGLAQMAIAVRQTYKLLDEVKTLLKRQKA